MPYFIVAVAAGMAIGLASTAVNAHPAPAGGGSGKQHLGRQAPTSKRLSDSEAQTGHQKHAGPHRSSRSERAHGRMRHEQGSRSTSASRQAAGTRELEQHFRDRDRFFARHGFGRGFVGWAGAVFWPYAYNDMLDYTFWPSYGEYYDPFWAYGFDELFAGIFWPQGATDLPSGNAGSRRVQTRRVASPAQHPTHNIDRRLCGQEVVSAVTFPFARIAKAVEPTGEAQAKFNELKLSSVQAVDRFKPSCPTGSALTPVDRLDTVEKRLNAMLEAVDIVQGVLQTFYQAMEDWQKIRLDHMSSQTNERNDNSVDQPTKATAIDRFCGEQSAGVAQFPIDRIAMVVAPNDRQKVDLAALRSAAVSAAESIKASCPAETPVTVIDRLKLVRDRIRALLAAVQMARPALQQFYAALDPEQQTRFNKLGQEEPP